MKKLAIALLLTLFLFGICTSMFFYQRHAIECGNYLILSKIDPTDDPNVFLLWLEFSCDTVSVIVRYNFEPGISGHATGVAVPKGRSGKTSIAFGDLTGKTSSPEYLIDVSFNQRIGLKPGDKIQLVRSINSNGGECFAEIIVQ